MTDKKLVVGVIISVALLFLLLSSVEKPRYRINNESVIIEEPIINESKVIEIIGEHYNDSEFDIEFNENCTENHGRACWKANITGIGEMVIESRSGKVIGIIKEPTIIYCNYTYTELTAGGETHYYNMGCDNPFPICDTDSETCRICTTKSECLRKRIARFITGVPEQILIWYGYDVVGTGVKGSFDDLSQKCTVSYNHSNLYIGLMNITECEDKILSYIDCIRGECKRL